MEKQIINCNIETCIYNDDESNRCTLKEINISDVLNRHAVKADQSMCCSYKYNR